MPRLYTLNINRFNKKKWFHIKKVKKQMISSTNYGDATAVLANTPTLAKSLLHSLEQVAGCIGFYVNANKTEFIGL